MLKLLFSVTERLAVIELFINSLFTAELYPQLFCKLNKGNFNLDTDAVISQLHTPVIVAENIPRLLDHRATLIFLSEDEIKSISNASEKITSTCKNYQARIIVIVDRYIDEIKLNNILSAFKIKLHLYLTVLYPHEEQTSSHMRAAFHNPFEMNKNGIFNGTNYFYDFNETTVVRVAKEIRLAKKYFSTQLNGFPINISTFCFPYIFYHCKFDVSYQRYVQQIGVIAEFMNWTTRITVETEFDNTVREEQSKTPLQVMREKSLSTDIFLFEYLRRDLKPTECFLYVSSQNTCPVGTKTFNPRWMHLKTIFDSPTYTLICSTIFICIVFFRIVTYIRLSKSTILNQGSTFKIVQSIFSITNMDRKALILSQQILWPVWMVFIVIITNTVTSSLGMKLILKDSSKPIRRYEDAVKLKVPIIDEFNLLNKTSIAPYIAQLAKQKVPTKCCFNLLFNQSISNDAIYFLSDRTKFLVIDMFGSIAKCPYYKLNEECFGENHVGYVMRNDFPFMEKVKDLMIAFEENGIFTKITKHNSHMIGLHRELFFGGMINNGMKLFEMSNAFDMYNTSKALSFNDLFLPFVVLILGLFGSAIILLFELLFYRMKFKIFN